MAAVAGTDFQAKAAHLWEHGYVVMDVLTDAEVSIAHAALLADVASFPEYQPGAERHVFNSFGAFGNASSFHCPTVRRLRMGVRAPVAEPLMRALVQLRFPGDAARQMRYRLETLFDRMGLRRAGTTTTAETWHRDTSVVPEPRAGDEPDDCFGGWLNLDLPFAQMRGDPLNARLMADATCSGRTLVDGPGRNTSKKTHFDTTQYFSCHAGTHRPRPAGAAGFAKLSQAECDAFNVRPKTVVPIKRGQWVIFFQSIVHEVNPRKMAFNSLRSYLGLRLTTHAENLFDTRANPALLAKGSEFVRDGPPGWDPQHFSFWNDIEQQGVPKLPSSQQSPTYAKLNGCFHKKELLAWSAETFVNVVRADADDAHVPRFLRSLQAYGLPLYAPYADAERALFVPRALFA